MFKQGFRSIEEVYGPHWRNISMITLAPELENSPDVIQNLTHNGVTVSVGKFKNRNSGKGLRDSFIKYKFFLL